GRACGSGRRRQGGGRRGTATHHAETCATVPVSISSRLRPAAGRPRVAVSVPPTALTIAGSDTSAGAGVQADLKTFAALGVYGLTAVTCVVAETPGKVAKIQPIGASMVRKQIDVLARSFPIAAIKTGLLYSADIVTAVARTMVDLSDKIERPI